jgi:hypothetical protein
MAKWKETTKIAKSSTEALVPYQTVITHKTDGTIGKIDTYYNDVRIFEDGAVLNRYAGSVQVIVDELTSPDLAFANNVDKAIQKLIGDRLPKGE